MCSKGFKKETKLRVLLGILEFGCLHHAVDVVLDLLGVSWDGVQLPESNPQSARAFSSRFRVYGFVGLGFRVLGFRV